MTCEYVQNLNLKDRVRFYSANKCLRNVVRSSLAKVEGFYPSPAPSRVTVHVAEP